jgi:hypothetical protein
MHKNTAGQQHHRKGVCANNAAINLIGGEGDANMCTRSQAHKTGRGYTQSIQGGEQYPNATGGWANSSTKHYYQTSQATRQEGGACVDQYRAGEDVNNKPNAHKQQLETQQSNKEHSKLGNTKAAIV